MTFVVSVELASSALRAKGAGKESVAQQPTLYRTIQVDGLSIFYRGAGRKDAPTLLLLHGLPSSSRMFEPLFARLSDRYNLVAPDYPGFGHSDWPDAKKFSYTFDHFAEIMSHVTEAFGLSRYTLYMQDYGGPVGFRMVLAHPGRVEALIVQDAVAHNEGLGANLTMANLSSVKHRGLYSPSATLRERLSDIKLILDAIRKLEISMPIKNRMLVHALWQIAIVSGNTQSNPLGRFRSEAVIRHIGLKIERDHIYRKENLVQELLGPSADLDSIIARAHCCVVTKDEHGRLGQVDWKIDGWQWYQAAGITAYDMASMPAQPVTSFQNV
jgi:pimeloyl-ACP methyl ester carboxylesterase